MRTKIRGERQNAFGMRLYDIKEVLEDRGVEQTVRSMLCGVFTHLEMPKRDIDKIVRQCLVLAKNYSSMEQYEEDAHKLLEKEDITKRILSKLSDRAALIYKQIRPYLIKGSVLDFGCGDGRIGELLHGDGFNVQLTDIYENGHVRETSLPFKRFGQGKDLPFGSRMFDNTIALTVYHHSEDPLHSVREAERVTKMGGLVVVIESVYGVDGRELEEKERKRIREYLALDDEGQRKVNIFFDHFYNRIIHFSNKKEMKVNVPFNFNTPDNWRRISELEGLREERVIHLGLDQATVPEYHTLHIFRVTGKR